MRIRRFLIGCIVGLAVAAALNLAPYVWTRYNSVVDDFEVMGFPMLFFRQGGFAGIKQFVIVALLIDLVFALLLALLAGWAAVRLSQGTRGFPPDSPGDKRWLHLLCSLCPFASLRSPAIRT